MPEKIAVFRGDFAVWQEIAGCFGVECAAEFAEWRMRTHRHPAVVERERVSGGRGSTDAKMSNWLARACCPGQVINRNTEFREWKKCEKHFVQ
jgi:hypothetical protein